MNTSSYLCRDVHCVSISDLFYLVLSNFSLAEVSPTPDTLRCLVLSSQVFKLMQEKKVNFPILKNSEA